MKGGGVRATIGAFGAASVVAVACGASHLGKADARRPNATVSEATSTHETIQSPEDNRAAWDRLAASDGSACRGKLQSLGISFRPLPDGVAPDSQGCGIPHGVLVERGPTGVKYSPPLQIDCSLAGELPVMERAIQAVAERELGESIVKISTFGTYSCRSKRGGVNGNLSEHAVGNAIDFGAFAPRHGRLINVKRDYRPVEDPPHAQSRFLRGVFQALRNTESLTHVIGPETRADHQDHIHVDRGASWWRRLAPR